VIAFGSVVTKDVPDNVVVEGEGKVLFRKAQRVGISFKAGNGGLYDLFFHLYITRFSAVSLYVHRGTSKYSKKT